MVRFSRRAVARENVKPRVGLTNGTMLDGIPMTDIAAIIKKPTCLVGYGAFLSQIDCPQQIIEILVIRLLVAYFSFSYVFKNYT
jgi:hypothetical protein